MFECHIIKFLSKLWKYLQENLEEVCENLKRINQDNLATVLEKLQENFELNAEKFWSKLWK